VPKDKTKMKTKDETEINTDKTEMRTKDETEINVDETKMETKDETNTKIGDEIKIMEIKKKISLDKPSPNFLIGWSLTVSDIIDNKTGFVAISCITNEDMNPNRKRRIFLIFRILFDAIRKTSLRFVELFILYCLVLFLLIFIIFLALPILYSIIFLCLSIMINLYYLVRTCEPYYVTNYDIEQFKLPWIPSKGIIHIFEFSFNDNTLIRKDRLDGVGGVVGFLKNSSKNNAILVCTNYIKIRKISIELKKINRIQKFFLNLFSEEISYLLPENLFKELKSIKNAKLNWKYLSKSRYQEFLMVDTNYNKQIQNIEIYDINTLQLVNVFNKHHEKNSSIPRNNEPGIFAISTDSRLFAYSCGDNIITIYLIESGLEVVSKKFESINKIKFLEFIENDKKLFIIEENESFVIEEKESDVNKSEIKFHIWILSGCLNDYFSISKDDIGLSDNNISILSKYDEHYNTLTKANGKVVFLNNKGDENHFKILSEISIEKAVLEENDSVIYGFEYNSRDLEPWNNNSTEIVRGRFLNNDKRFILIKGQNSIQLWRSKSIDFVNFNNFKNFENSNLVYILISDNIKSSKFQIDDDMTTIITHACKSLAYLYNQSTKNISSKEKHQKFVNGIINIIKDFINKYPDNWKLMEVQYPLMAYLIYSRSYSLIKYILFGTQEDNTGMLRCLHRPQNKCASYLQNDLKLQDEDLEEVLIDEDSRLEVSKLKDEDTKLKDEVLKLEDEVLKLEDEVLILKDDDLNLKEEVLELKEEVLELKDEALAEVSKLEDGVLKDELKELKDKLIGLKDNLKELKVLKDKLFKLIDENLKSANVLELTLKFAQG
jgi:hypothetical protein